MANIERLKELRRVVLAAPEHQFHMRTWCEKADCGTARCAAGWAAVDPWFQENTEILEIFAVDEAKFVTPVTDFSCFSAIGKLFGIEYRQSCHVFGSDPCGLGMSDPHSVSKDQVVANIDALIAGTPTKSYYHNG